MKNKRQTPLDVVRDEYKHNHASSLYFFKIVIKWLGIGVLLLIVGLLIYHFIR